MHRAGRRAYTLTTVTTTGLLVVAGLNACGSSGTPAADGKGSPTKDIPSIGELYKQARDPRQLTTGRAACLRGPVSCAIMARATTPDGG